MNKEDWDKKWLGQLIVFRKNIMRDVFVVDEVFKESYFKPVRLKVRFLGYESQIILDAKNMRKATDEEIAYVIARKIAS